MVVPAVLDDGDISNVDVQGFLEDFVFQRGVSAV